MTTAIEVEGADFEDARLSRRLNNVAGMLGQDPSLSFPEAARDDAELEATYRFLSNDRVTAEQILAPHVRRTVGRVLAADGAVVVAHDTTEFGFSGARSDLGRVTDSGHGFFAHTALATTVETREPLGVLGVDTWKRQGASRPNKTRHSERRPETERESSRWWSLVHEVEEVLDLPKTVIHVMDREADDFVLLARLTAAGHRFVIRSKHDRKLDGGQVSQKISDALAPVPVRFHRDVELSARRNTGKKAHPARSERVAPVAVRVAPVGLRKPKPAPVSDVTLPSVIELSVVHVLEVAPPTGAEPVEWRLLTTEPVETDEQIGHVLEAYRARWVIEEYFKALKTGCNFEKRQLETMHALANALAVFIPIAWSLLRLRNVARTSPDRPADHVLTRLQIQLLQSHKKSKLVPVPTVRDALLAIARLGGHLARNGDPGWRTLGRGYEKLLAFEEGALLALAGM